MGQTVVLYTRGAIAPRRVMLVGLGERAKLTLDQVRRVSAIAARAVRKLGVVRYCFGMLDGEPVGLGAEGVAQAIGEGHHPRRLRVCRTQDGLPRSCEPRPRGAEHSFSKAAILLRLNGAPTMVKRSPRAWLWHAIW